MRTPETHTSATQSQRPCLQNVQQLSGERSSSARAVSWAGSRSEPSNKCSAMAINAIRLRERFVVGLSMARGRPAGANIDGPTVSTGASPVAGSRGLVGTNFAGSRAITGFCPALRKRPVAPTLEPWHAPRHGADDRQHLRVLRSPDAMCRLPRMWPCGELSRRASRAADHCLR
jgi:hypothetical protein